MPKIKQISVPPNSNKVSVPANSNDLSVIYTGIRIKRSTLKRLQDHHSSFNDSHDTVINRALDQLDKI